MLLYGNLNLIQKRHYLVYILLIFAKNECENENHVLWETLELEENFSGNRWGDQVHDKSYLQGTIQSYHHESFLKWSSETLLSSPGLFAAFCGFHLPKNSQNLVGVKAHGIK